MQTELSKIIQKPEVSQVFLYEKSISIKRS